MMKHILLVKVKISYSSKPKITFLLKTETSKDGVNE